MFFFQCLDEYDDDEAGQKERKREDAITQQNTIQNESASTDPSDSCILQVSSLRLFSYWNILLYNLERNLTLFFPF